VLSQNAQAINNQSAATAGAINRMYEQTLLQSQKIDELIQALSQAIANDETHK
jgi:hypothetical protein